MPIVCPVRGDPDMFTLLDLRARVILARGPG